MGGMKRLLCSMAVGIAVLLLGMQAAPSAPAPVTVHMSDFAFHPDSLKIHTGDTVVFQNDDQAVHNVSADAFQSGDVQPGKSWSYTFSKAGTYTYVCTYHDGMKGTITVSDQ